jgi:hypothetical protein
VLCVLRQQWVNKVGLDLDMVSLGTLPHSYRVFLICRASKPATVGGPPTPLNQYPRRATRRMSATEPSVMDLDDSADSEVDDPDSESSASIMDVDDGSDSSEEIDLTVVVSTYPVLSRSFWQTVALIQEVVAQPDVLTVLLSL